MDIQNSNAMHFRNNSNGIILFFFCKWIRWGFILTANFQAFEIDSPYCLHLSRSALTKCLLIILLRFSSFYRFLILIFTSIEKLTLEIVVDSNTSSTKSITFHSGQEYPVRSLLNSQKKLCIHYFWITIVRFVSLHFPVHITPISQENRVLGGVVQR